MAIPGFDRNGESLQRFVLSADEVQSGARYRMGECKQLLRKATLLSVINLAMEAYGLAKDALDSLEDDSLTKANRLLSASADPFQEACLLQEEFEGRKTSVEVDIMLEEDERSADKEEVSRRLQQLAAKDPPVPATVQELVRAILQG